MVKPKNMKLTGSRVLVKADPPVKKTASGLLIEEDWKSLPPFGVVHAVGPDVQKVKVGDRVLFERYGSITVRLNPGDASEKDWRLCLEDHVIARVHEGNEAN